jgi:hypothetical protein
MAFHAVVKDLIDVAVGDSGKTAVNFSIREFMQEIDTARLVFSGDFD